MEKLSLPKGKKNKNKKQNQSLENHLVNSQVFFSLMWQFYFKKPTVNVNYPKEKNVCDTPNSENLGIATHALW